MSGVRENQPPAQILFPKTRQQWTNFIVEKHKTLWKNRVQGIEIGS